MVARLLLSLVALGLLVLSVAATSSDHTNNWAVLVCSSRFWFNYRHMANTLGMYRTVKRLGIPDSQIILMLSDDVACSARNSFPGTVFANKDRGLDLYGERVEVDYRGYEVSVESFMRLLTGRQPATTPRSQRLLSDENSNVFVYMTGHGGDEFLKFQDNEEISAFDVADAIEQMYEKKRYNKMLLMFDTCQANTMYSKVYSPNVLATGSSKLGEPSYSHHSDPDIGVAVIDSYTHHVLDFMEGINKTSTSTFADLFETMSFEKVRSTAGVRTDLFPFDLSHVLLTDFFGGVASVEVDSSPLDTASFERAASTEGEEVRPPVVREGLAAGQARREREHARRETIALGRQGQWVSWNLSEGEGGTLQGLGWVGAGLVGMGLVGWAGRKA